MIWLLLDQLTTLRNGWLSSKFGYYPEGGKSWLVIRENAEEHAESIFKHQYKNHNRRQKTSRDSQRHYKLSTKLHERKIERWVTESRMLCEITWYEPQAAYSCFITGFKHKPAYSNYSNISSQFMQLDGIVRTGFILAI